MFETLSERLGAILDKLTRKARLSRPTSTRRCAKSACLARTDVALDVVRDFAERRESEGRWPGVVRSTTPGRCHQDRA